MRCTDGAALSITSRGVGPVILGGGVAALRARCPVRDTAWTAEGMPETGVLVDVGDDATLLAVTTGTRDSTVTRIVVSDPEPRTASGTGVGSSVADLRRAHGRVCGAVGEGLVVAHVPGGSGIAFALTIPSGALPKGGLEIAERPEMIPDSAHVSTLWVHEGETSCGAGSAAGDSARK